MVEVLISILVMTFGLLGISGLMMKGVDNSTGSDLASHASQSASEIMDAMRANSKVNTATNSTYLTTYNTPTSTLTGTLPENTDRLQWLQAIRRLPGGDGKIERDAAVVNGYIVTVRFANCIGTLSQTEKDKCVAAFNNGEKREIAFKFKI